MARSSSHKAGGGRNSSTTGPANPLEHLNRSGTVPVNVLDEIVKRIVEVVHPQRIILFGSGARGKMGPDSDLDLLVVMRGSVHRRDMERAICRGLWGIRYPVDAMVVTEQDIERYGNSIGMVIAPALKEGREVYVA